MTERGFIMTEKGISGKCRKKFHRGRRRRQKGTKTVVFSAVLLLAVVIAAGFIWKASYAKEGSADMKPAVNLWRGSADVDTQEDLASGADSQGRDLQTSGTPWYLTLVNGQNPIPEDYEPELVEVQGGELVDSRILGPLMSMLEDAREANRNQLPWVVSGYRTADKQQSLYDEKIAEYKIEGYSESEAREFAEQWVAKPGYSEHQLGFAVDINGETYDVYSWLMENSYKYGFIFRYPGNKTQITGVSEEVWHYRYVGEEAAAEMYEQGVCLEEYLENMPMQSKK